MTHRRGAAREGRLDRRRAGRAAGADADRWLSKVETDLSRAHGWRKVSAVRRSATTRGLCRWPQRLTLRTVMSSIAGHIRGPTWAMAVSLILFSVGGATWLNAASRRLRQRR